MLNGSGVDTTATVIAWLKAHKQIDLADLYLIGEDDDPRAIWLTNYPSSLTWSPWGVFQAAVLKRGAITNKIGLEAESLDITWSPKNVALTSSLETASPYQQARLGVYDNWRVRMWRCYMPTPGDANTFGAMELFAGWVGQCTPQRGSIGFQVNSYLYALNQKVPTGIIEVTSTLASYSGGVPPAGYTSMPQFNVIAGGGNTPTVIYADQDIHHPPVPDPDTINGSYVVFNGGGSNTMRGLYSLIARNSIWHDLGGGVHTELQLYSPLPWAPTPGVDTFYISSQAPINQADGDYAGFPYVPAPETAA
jgi:hypothetical protein